MELSSRWVLPPATQVERSCTTMQLPFSAFLNTKCLFLPSSWRIHASFLERSGLGVIFFCSSAVVSLCIPLTSGYLLLEASVEISA